MLGEALSFVKFETDLSAMQWESCCEPAYLHSVVLFLQCVGKALPLVTHLFT